MDLDLYVDAVPALTYELTACTIDQLDQLERQANEVVERVRCAKNGGSIIASLISRYQGRQFVRCTNQSVKTTAGARYDPASSDFDLSSLSIVCFVGVVTYLPLPSVKSLIANESATRWAEQMWQGKDPDARWGTYYTCLTSVNPAWASLFMEEMQLLTGGSIIQQTHPDAMPSAVQDQQIVYSESRNQAISESTGDDQAEQREPLQNEDLLRRVIKAKASAWGPGHSTTIDSIVHLADLYVSQTRVTEARSLLLQTFRDWRSTGTEHTAEVWNLLTLLAEVDCQLETR